mgnify:CR=1 FL=1
MRLWYIKFKLTGHVRTAYVWAETSTDAVAYLIHLCMEPIDVTAIAECPVPDRPELIYLSS